MGWPREFDETIRAEAPGARGCSSFICSIGSFVSISCRLGAERGTGRLEERFRLQGASLWVGWVTTQLEVGRQAAVSAAGGRQSRAGQGAGGGFLGRCSESISCQRRCLSIRGGPSTEGESEPCEPPREEFPGRARLQRALSEKGPCLICLSTSRAQDIQ